MMHDDESLMIKPCLHTAKQLGLKFVAFGLCLPFFAFPLA